MVIPLDNVVVVHRLVFIEHTLIDDPDEIDSFDFDDLKAQLG
jgi:hypothetical protein